MYAPALPFDMRRPEFIRLFLLGSLAALLLVVLISILPSDLPGRKSGQHAAVSVVSPFIYSFNAPGILNEASSMSLSTSPYWWLNSGGQFVITGDSGSTMRGEAPLWNYWRLLYALTNPIDTDLGAHPQNVFRLVSRSTWEDVRMEAQFKILKDNWSTSPNRNASNGLLLMNRYVNDDTVYYAGIRVDGLAVIKKKYDGVYYTMAQKQEFAGTYAVGERISMLPHQIWIGLRSETITNTDGSVSVKLYMQKEGGTWKKLLEARDSGAYGGTPPIIAPGFVGMRTDFMDVAFDNVRMETI
jgi:hypothetical protein